MDISSMLGKNNGSKDAKAISVDEVNDDGGQFEALGDYNVDGQGHRLEFNPNETINTSDNAVVGDYNVVKPQYTDPEPIVTPSQPEAIPAPTDDEAIDPAKMDFIKTYTREYDDTVASATHAVELILSAIDKTVHDHTNNIDIPEEALPFIDDKPKDNKVSKFDDAQQIVRTIMGRASEAKSQGEQRWKRRRSTTVSSSLSETPRKRSLLSESGMSSVGFTESRPRRPILRYLS